MNDSRKDSGNGSAHSSSKTVSLQGVASFANLAELLAHALGTMPGKIHASIPVDPSSFNEMFAEIDKNDDQFVRRVTLLAKPGSPLTLRVHSATYHARKMDSLVGGAVVDLYPGVTVAQLVPQVNALAREIEAVFAVTDRLVAMKEHGKAPAPRPVVHETADGKSGGLAGPTTLQLVSNHARPTATTYGAY
jgi:hypothetical protein